MVSMLQRGLCVLVLAATGAVAFNATEDVGNDYAPNPNISESVYDLPAGFLIGAASSTYQIDGAWNISGKGPNIFDTYFHKNESLGDGDVAASSFHKYREDVQLIKNLGMNAYRFSISWSRILPNGTTDYINQEGIEFYNNLINELLRNNIEPVVTIFHMDLPQALQDLGGWTGNSSIQDYYLDFANLVFEQFGDRVRWWITLNEPNIHCAYILWPLFGGGGANNESGVANYLCSHNLLLAHAKAYRSYYKHFASKQGGQVGVTTNFIYGTPLEADNNSDREAAERYMQFWYAWIMDAVVYGDYPQIMRDVIANNSKAEGRNASRLVPFTDEEKKLLKGTVDFLGTNHYTTSYTTLTCPSSNTTSCTASDMETSYDNDMGVTLSVDDRWTLGIHSSTATPWGFRGLLNWIKERYHNIPVFITENGYVGSEAEGLDDYNRISFLSTYLRALLRSVKEDNCNIIGYMAWALFDDFEWTSGYEQKFGFYKVDYDDPDRKRTRKKSGTFMQNIIRANRVPYYGFQYASLMEQ